MERFKDAQVGDLVYSRIHGNGVITSIQPHTLECYFDLCTAEQPYFSFDGRWYPNDVEPTLFYRDDKNKYLTERPASKVPWDKVPVDTPVQCLLVQGGSIINRHFSHVSKNGTCYVYPNGTSSFTTDTPPVYVKSISLLKDIEIDGILCKKGSS